MASGVELDLGVREGTPNEDFIAMAVANIAAFSLEKERGEGLQWQVIRVDAEGHHHFRLVVRHPDRALDLGLKHALERELDRLSSMDAAAVRKEYERCGREGLKPSRLRHVSEHPDVWRDDFWNWIG